MSKLEEILDQIKASDAASSLKLNWQPPLQGELDIRIAADGSWFHEGRKFQRDSLVKLFASVLRCEGNQHFLVTPTEKLQIQVDDAPFIATLVEQIDADGQQAIVFTTNIEDRIMLDNEHKIRLDTNAENGEPRPYIHCRNGLEALISRSAFYDLLNMATEIEKDQRNYLAVSSMGIEFELGPVDTN